MFGATNPKTLMAASCATLALATALSMACAMAQETATTAPPPARGAIPLPAGIAADAAAPAALSIPLIGILGADPEPASRTIPLAAASGDAVAATAPITLAGPRIEPAAAAAPTAQAPAAKAIGPLAGLWPVDLGRVANGRAQFRGERDSLDFALFVPPGAQPSELTVSAVSSAFILPGRSMLRVYSGDRLIGETPLRSITGLERATFALEPGILTPGINRIRIEVDLAHRLYCGALPAYDLWTNVDLAASGVPFAPEAMGANDDAFLAAANVARTTRQPLLLRSDPATLATSAVAREITRRLGQALGGGLTFTTRERPVPAGGFQAPVIEISETGTPGARFRLGPQGEQILEVHLDNGTTPPLFDAAETAATEAPPPELPQDVPVPLRELGFSTVRIAEHLWTDDVAFRLPSDWLMNVRERAVLNLGYAYLPGMPTGAEMRVLINGDVVRIIPLDRGGRLESAPLEVRFDAGLLRAGRNLLGFEVVVPGDPADQPCLTADVGRVEIRGSSTLIVPSTPRMHMPGITRWMAGGGPLSIEAPANAALAGDAAQSEAYLNLAAALHGAGDANADEAARRLVALRPTDLSSAVFGGFGMGRQAMLAALQRPAVAGAPSVPPAPLGAANAQDLDQAPLTYAVERNGYLDAAMDGARKLRDRGWQAFRRLALPDPVADLGSWLSYQHGQAILFQLDRAAPDDLNLLVADGASTDEVLTAIGQAAERGVPLDGHVAVLGWDGAWATWTDDTRLPVLEENLSQKNWRGVVGNFASAQPRVFVGLLVGIAMISVLIANSYIGASRRQR